MTPRRKDNRLRLLSYARVSAVRGREGPGFISESDQFERNRAYAAAYAHRIIDEGSDLDVSGGVMSRPVFDRFLDTIARGEADGIIVAKLDRFARSNVGALAAVERIENAGGTLISVAEQLDASTGAGRFLRTILFTAAQWERDRIGEQWRTARSRAVERGIHIIHHVPPGYVRSPRTNDEATDRRLTPHPVHAETIRHAYEMAKAGASYSSIADYLNERDLPVTSVKEGDKATFWQPFRIRRLLANRVYLGEASSGSGMVHTNAHEPLVDPETWLLAQRGASPVQEPRRPSRRATVLPSILSGIVRCAGCSFAMKPQEAGKTAGALYRCVKTSVSGRCPSPSVIAKGRVEDYVIERFLDEADTYLLSSRTAAEQDGAEQLIVAANTAESSYRAQLANIELRNLIGDADHDALIASLYRDWQEKRAASEDVQATRAAATALELPKGMSLRALVRKLRDEGRNAELRSLLALGIEAVYVRPAESRRRNLPVGDRVHIVWRGTEKLELPRRGGGGHRFEPRAYRW
jgi:DNA invertase Pin-like site-specific DNA recombinase